MSSRRLEGLISASAAHMTTTPIELPDRFRFVVHARTTAALGLTLPSTLRVLADEVVLSSGAR